MFDTIVTVEVGGPFTKEFHLHKGILKFYSGYFAAALKDNFKEGKEGVLSLPMEYVGTFTNFVGWVYRKSLRKRP
jgi:hypothetical protein